MNNCKKKAGILGKKTGRFKVLPISFIKFICEMGLGATALIVAHNHPSGKLSPSKSDLKLTTKIKKAGENLDIKLLDHLIISEKGYYSFADEKLL